MMLPRLFDLDKKTMDLASRDMPYPRGSWNLTVETSRIFHRCLSPGPSLEKTEQAALTRILGYLNEQASELASDPDDVAWDLFSWLWNMMTESSTEAVSVPTPPLTHDSLALLIVCSCMDHGIHSMDVLNWSRHSGQSFLQYLVLSCPLP